MELTKRQIRREDLNEKIKEMEENLARWQGEIEDDANFDEKLAQLKEKRRQVEGKLEAMENATEDAWQQLSDELDTAWGEFQSAYDELLNKDENGKYRPSSELLKGKMSGIKPTDDQRM